MLWDLSNQNGFMGVKSLSRLEAKHLWFGKIFSLSDNIDKLDVGIEGMIQGFTNSKQREQATRSFMPEIIWVFWGFFEGRFSFQ